MLAFTETKPSEEARCPLRRHEPLLRLGGIMDQRNQAGFAEEHAHSNIESYKTPLPDRPKNLQLSEAPFVVDPFDRADRRTILITGPDWQLSERLGVALRDDGFAVQIVGTDAEALWLLKEQHHELMVISSASSQTAGVELILRIRCHPAIRLIPIVLIMEEAKPEEVIFALESGADDFLLQPFALSELVTRIRLRLQRPTNSGRVDDRRTDVLTETVFSGPLGREVERARITREPLVLAVLQFDEMARLRTRYGVGLDEVIGRQVVELLQTTATALTVVAQNGNGGFYLLAPTTTAGNAMRQARETSLQLMEHEFIYHGDRLRLTPIIGLALYQDGQTLEAFKAAANSAVIFAGVHLDLQPVLYDPHLHALPTKVISGEHRFYRLNEALTLPLQMVVATLLLVVMPFLFYALLAASGHDVSGVAYAVVVVALVSTAFLILLEGVLALNPVQPPLTPGLPSPPASAIIAAYLPNEAATIIETVEAFLMVDYPAGLQVVLAYNTPRDLPVEELLREIARRDSRFVAMRVEGSTSKAQNVNAALAQVTGTFTAIFDADHHPDPDSFIRAWRWLSNGWDVVQGHCLIRNGDESWVSRTVAVEFEGIYAVSHPGRARMHQFGIFGGSNGYWNTRLLKKIRMRGSMLTEDIDSSLRAVLAGYKIGNDPYLISRELAPTTLAALTSQRLRWAQGWFQVSLKHLWLALRSPVLTFRQKLGFFHLLGWREIYPILAVQVFPIIAYWLLVAHRPLSWGVPILVLTTLFTLSVGPLQTLFAYLRADPMIRRRRGWFWAFLLVTSVFYAPYKNLLAVVGQIKEVRRERSWKVTPRTSSGLGSGTKPVSPIDHH